MSEDEPTPAGGSRAVVVLCLLAAGAGVVTGFVGGAFRWCLERADEYRGDLVGWAHDTGAPAWMLPVVVAAAGAGIARLIVQWVPLAAGSGIQHVEAVWRGEVPAAKLRVLPAKFVGGVLAIGSGLVLGREGPTVHMGAVVGAETARRAKLDDDSVRVMQTALGGAGLAVAFNAPIGGALFVFEEVTREIRTRLVLATLIGCAVAVACSRLVVGDHADFLVAPIETPSILALLVFVAFGLLTGLLGVAYNRLIVGFLVLADRLRRVDPVLIATVIGALVGLALLADPLMVGGGDTLSQLLLLAGSTFALPTLVGYLLVRFVAGPLSYAAGTPGGLFAPILALGALWGVLVHGVLGAIAPALAVGVPSAFAVVGMAALFAAVVRAPFTGLVLVIEMTAITTLTVPMLAGTAAATLAANLVKGAPIYQTLRERMLHQPPRT